MSHQTTALHKVACLFSLCAISGCAPTLSVTAVKDPNYHQSPQRILAVEDLGFIRSDPKMTGAFNQRLESVLSQCNVASEKYVITEPSTSLITKDKLREDVGQLTATFKPDAILEINEISHTTYTQNNIPMGTNPNAFSYTLRTPEGNKVWTAQIQLKGMYHDTEDMYKALALGVVSAMRGNGILASCPEQFKLD